MGMTMAISLLGTLLAWQLCGADDLHKTADNHAAVPDQEQLRLAALGHTHLPTLDCTLPETDLEVKLSLPTKHNQNAPRTFRMKDALIAGTAALDWQHSCMRWASSCPRQSQEASTSCTS